MVDADVSAFLPARMVAFDPIILNANQITPHQLGIAAIPASARAMAATNFHHRSNAINELSEFKAHSSKKSKMKKKKNKWLSDEQKSIKQCDDRNSKLILAI